MRTVSICVCTYRRPDLADTLRSLAALDLPGEVRAEVVVIDNDDTPSARALAEGAVARADLPLRYLHAPAGNISIARNAALDAASGRFLAFIDDDEIASPGWLAALLREQEATGADVVLGPVHAIYGASAPDWMRAAALHATKPVVSGGEIRTGYSGNVLIDRHAPSIAGLRFDLALGRTGGEDTMFFGRAYRAGAIIAFAADAHVSEAVPAARLSMTWLARRRLRSGRTHARLLLEVDGRNRLSALALAGAKAAYCALTTLALLPVRGARSLSALRFLFHAGVVAGLASAQGGDAPGRWMQAARE